MDSAKNPGFAEMIAVAKNMAKLLFLSADSEGIFLQVTVPHKIRSSEKEGIKQQVHD